MAISAPAFITVNPSIVIPEPIIQFNQRSNFIDLFGQADLIPKLAEGTLQVYAKRISLFTKVAAGQTPANVLPGISATFELLSAPTYTIRARSQYTNNDIVATNNWGVSHVEIEKLGRHQGIFQQIRNAALYGMNPANGEGLINMIGATHTTLPADSYGNTTAKTYDNGEMSQFLVQLIVDIQNRILMTGRGKRFSILGPLRLLNKWQTDIIQLTQYQREGAGSATVVEMIEKVVSRLGCTLDWGYDDTLIGKGAGGTDAVIITVPELNLSQQVSVSTDQFSKLANGLTATNAIFSDMTVPMDMMGPLGAEATDVVSQIRITSGWSIRPEALTILSVQYI